jgi:DNA-binding beta-propeller fold protein YncE
MTLFPSLRALQEAHRALLQRFRKSDNKLTPELLRDIEQFLRDGSETGRVLHLVSDQIAAQGLLDYWSAVLFREHKDAPEALLEEFDPTAEPQLTDDECPYVGLRSFQKSEGRIFFGRENLIRDLLQLLQTGNFVAVMGAPGSGRTSLVQAGLLSALARGQLPGSETWPVYEAAPSLKSQIETATNDLTSITIIDDCDDVFGRDSDRDQSDFAEGVLKLADSPGKRRIVVLTLRGGYEKRFARFSALEERIKQGRLRIANPTAKELREAIERPADLVGLKFEDGVVDAIVDQLVGEQAPFALLQFTMLRLWQKRSHNRITWEAVHDAGVGRAAMVRAAQAFHDGLTAEQQKLLRQLLVRLRAGGQSAAVPWHDLPAATDNTDEAAKLLDAMAAAGLVAVSTRVTGEKAVKLAHDSLAEQWDTLAEWLNDEREHLAFRRRLEARTTAWVNLGRPSSAVLSELELVAAKQWLDSPAGSRIGVSEAVRAFLAASEWRRRRKLFYLGSVAAAFAVLAGIASYEWYLTDIGRTDEHLQVELTTLAVIERELVQNVNDPLWAFASQLMVSAERAPEGEEGQKRRRNLEAQAERYKDTLRGKRVQLAASRDRTISKIVEENSKRWKKLSEPDQQRIIKDALQLIDSLDDTFGPDGKLKVALVVTAAIPSSVPELNQALRKIISEYRLRYWYQPAGSSQIWGVAFNPNQETPQAAIGDDVGVVRLWDPAANQTTTLSSQASSVVNGVAFSSDGKLLAAAYRGSGAVVWSLQPDNQATEACALREIGGVYSVAFAPSGKILAVAASDKAAHLWDLSGQKSECKPRDYAFRHDDEVFGVAFSPDGRLLATAGGDKKVKLWNVDEPAQPLHTFETSSPMFAVAFSATGEQLAAAGGEGETHIWEIETKQEVVKLEKQDGTIGQIAFSPDGKLLVATARSDGRAFVSDARTGKIVDRFRSSSDAPLFGVAFSPDSKYLLTGNLDGFARLWATSDNEVDISDREGLIRRAKELSTSSVISLKENECQALRRLTIPIFEFADKPWNKTERSLLCPLPFLEPPVDEKVQMKDAPQQDTATAAKDG